jgi:hypothetical protein
VTELSLIRVACVDFDRASATGARIDPGHHGSGPMRMHRFGRKLKLPSTSVIKHQIRKLMLEDLIKEAEAASRIENVLRASSVEALSRRLSASGPKEGLSCSLETPTQGGERRAS